MSRKSQNVIRHRQKRRLELIKIMGGKCAICGYDKNSAALELHHINPLEKSYTLSAGNCRSIEEDIQEAKKCILLCSNCHREIHNGKEIELKSSFQPKVAEEILNEYYKATPPDKKCPRCGKIIFRTSKYCVKCFNEIKKEENLKTRPSREELKQLIRTIPFTKIGERFQVTDNAIRKWCDGYNLPRKKKDINNYSDEEWAKI